MPMREDASYCRPRLYDEHDDEKPDDVGLVMDSLESSLKSAMDEGDDERVWHIRDLMKRINSSQGGDYDRLDEEPEPVPEQ